MPASNISAASSIEITGESTSQTMTLSVAVSLTITTDGTGSAVLSIATGSSQDHLSQ